MGLSRILLPWDSQPQEVVELADGYRDAAIGWLAGNPLGNLGSVGPWTQQGTLTSVVTANGPALKSPAYASNNRLTGALQNPTTLAWPGVTVVASLTAASLANNSFPAIASWMGVGEFYGGFSLSVETTSIGRKIILWRAGNSTNFITPTTYNLEPLSDQYSADERLTIVAGWDLATTWIVVNRNGVLSFNSNAHAVGWRNLSSLFALLGYARSGFRTSEHPVNSVVVLPRSLRSQAQDLALNPWQLFAPRSIWVPVSAGGGGATDAAITAAAGTSTVSTLTGASTAATTPTAAAGATTAATVAASSTAATAITAAAGTSTAATITASATLASAITAAAGAATGSTLTASSVAAGAITAAAGVGTGETLVGGTLAAGAASITPAVGVSTAATITGFSTAASSFVPSEGSATAAVLVGSGGAAPITVVSLGGGGWLPKLKRRTKKELDEERRKLGILPPEVVEEVAAAPVARRRITLQDLIGKRAAAQITNVDLSDAIAASKRRKRQKDDELLLLM